ncbi:hypothetical protein B0J18DRAFT_466468 [Chaetomium sp. MPI-SDFR-AT-0129]|nr:hypothetical protein B0J18DRAFT_466468 [Chaetomium sp. MPI-SDFR-AT-0129]
MANLTTTTTTCECHINTTALRSQPPSVWRNNPAACLDQCRTQFLGGLLTAWGEESSSTTSGNGNGWEQGCGSLNKGVDVREFWTLYWCDATFCGVAIEEGVANVDRIINTCQNIGFYSLLDPGPPPTYFHCPLDSNSSGDCSFTALTAPQATRNPEIDPGSTAPTQTPTTDGSSSSSSPASASSSSSTPSSTPADTTSPPTNNLTAQGKAAIAICSVLALIILITVVLLCLHRHKRRKASLDDDAGADVPPSRRAREGLLAQDPEGGNHPDGGGGGETVASGASPTPLVSPTTDAVDYGNGRKSESGNGNEKKSNGGDEKKSNGGDSKKGILKTTTTATTTATTSTSENGTGKPKRSNPPLRLRDRKFLFPSILRAASSSGNNNGKSRAYSPPLSPLTSVHSTHSTTSHPPSRSGVAFASGATSLSEKDGHGIFPASPICSPTVTKLFPRQEKSGAVTTGRSSEAGYADYPPPPPPPPPSVLSSASALSSPEKKVRLDSPRTNFSLPVPLLKGTKGEKQGIQKPEIPSDPEQVPIVGGDPNRASDSASSYYTNGTSTAHSSLRHHEIPIGIPLFAGDSHARSPSPCPSLSPSPLRPPRPHEGPLHVPGLLTARGRSTGTGSGSYTRNEILLPGDYHPRGRTGSASITSVSSTPPPPPLSPPPTRALPKTPNGGASSPSPPPTREVSVSLGGEGGDEKGLAGVHVPRASTVGGRAFPLVTPNTKPAQTQIQSGTDPEPQPGPAEAQRHHQPDVKVHFSLIVPDRTPEAKLPLNTVPDHKPNAKANHPNPELKSAPQSTPIPNPLSKPDLSNPTGDSDAITISPTPSPLPQHLGLGSPAPGPSAAVDGPPPPYEYDQTHGHSYSQGGQSIPRKGGDNDVPSAGGTVLRRGDWRGSWGSWGEMGTGMGGGNGVSGGDDGISGGGRGYNSLDVGGEGIGMGRGGFDGEVDSKGPGLAGVSVRGETAG